jgi:hypothetical protein
MTGKLPLYETKNNTRVQLRVLRGDRPSKPALQDPAFRKYGLTEDIWNFIQACWLQEPEQRPTAKELCEHPVLSSLADHRPPQEWGEGSAVDFRSRHASNSSSKLPNPGGSTHSKPLSGQEPVGQTSPVDGFDALAKVVEAVGEGHCPVLTIRAHLLRVLASEDMRQEMLRLGKARSEKWVDAFQMVSGRLFPLTILASHESRIGTRFGSLEYAGRQRSLHGGAPPLVSCAWRTP